MVALNESTKINLYPTIELKPDSPKRVFSPQKITREDQSQLLNKPPRRISPFKGKKSLLTDKEIFGITPKRLLHTKTQSVDRNGFSFTSLEKKPDLITFSAMKEMAASKSLNTPSRMVRGGKPSSEQVSRLNRPTVASTLRTNDPTVNLMSKFQAKPILKRKLSPTNESDESIDMATTLNTMKNTGHPKDVLSFLKGPELIQPRKKRAVTFDSTDEIKGVSNEDLMKTLQQILTNQETILQKLTKLEDRQ